MKYRYISKDMRTCLLSLVLLAACKAPPPAKPQTCPPTKCPTQEASLTATPNRVTWEVHFSPNGGCTQAAVDLINGATTSVRIQAYSFTSKPIADAVLLAQTKKKDVQAIFDSSDQIGIGSKTGLIVGANIPTWFDYKHVIAHNKLIITDSMKVMTGSFNFTEAAESRNAENCIILTGSQLAKAYLDNWTLHQAHSIQATPGAPAVLIKATAKKKHRSKHHP